MSADRLKTEFCCSDCNEHFELASGLLTHFAQHASQLNQDTRTDHRPEKKSLPDLYPIKLVKNVKSERNDNAASDRKEENTTGASKSLHEYSATEHFEAGFPPAITCGDSEEVDDHGSNNLQIQMDSESDFNPLKYCTVSMDVRDHCGSTAAPESAQKKRYACSFCSKIFGWSTDLKRHILTHTGERPFKCKICDASFTRNFLLQKHDSKAHQGNFKSCGSRVLKMPSLKPIFADVSKIKAKESRKQDKQKIKRRCFYGSDNRSSSSDFCGILRTQLSLIDKETIVQ